MPRKPLAFLTMDCLAGFVAYDELAKPPLAERGWNVRDVSWKDPTARWDNFSAVIVRSPWDYHTDSAAFLQVVEAIDRSSARLLNPADTIRWNIDKMYLRDLQHQGLPIVPTQWVHSPDAADLQRAASHFSVNEIVLKPTLGAGARDTYRLASDVPLPREVVSLYQDRDAMLQPFLSSVVEQGEWSLFYFGEAYSHTVLKTPAEGDYRVQEEYGSRLRAVEAAKDLRCLGDATMEALRTLVPPTLYARVDMVRLADQSPAIIELELIEPSLYFPYDAASPQRFADAVDNALRLSRFSGK